MKARKLLCIVVLFAAVNGLAAGTRKMPMSEHLQIQKGKLEVDRTCEALPSIRIDMVTSNVSLDDRWDADDVFDRPFLEALTAGLKWYLAKRGMRVVESGEQIRVVATIEQYEGFSRGDNYGVDIYMRVRLRPSNSEQKLRLKETSVRSLFKYSGKRNVTAEEKPKYKALGKKVSFDEILFSRIGMDLGEKLISFLEEASSSSSAEASH